MADEANIPQADDADDAAQPGSPSPPSDETVNQEEPGGVAAQAPQDEPGADAPADSASQTPDEAEGQSAAISEDAGSAAEGNLIDQSELDSLVAQLEGAKSAPQADATDASADSELEDEMAAAIAAEMAAEQRAEAAPSAATAAPAREDPVVVGSRVASITPDGATPFEIAGFSNGGTDETLTQIDMLDDVELDVRIELGRTQMYIEDVLRLGDGSVVELDKLAGDPVDIFVNERLVARGEVLVLNENFCVRINKILSSTSELEDGK